MRTWVPPLLIGLVTGFDALWLREMGWIIAASVLILLPIVYLRLQRRTAVGWLFLGAGVAPIVILGRTIVASIVDPAVHVFPGTWTFFVVAVVLAVAGIAITLRARGQERIAP